MTPAFMRMRLDTACAWISHLKGEVAGAAAAAAAIARQLPEVVGASMV